MRWTLTGLAALVALAGGLPAAASAATAGRVSGTSSWTTQATPLPRGAANGYLPAVSCTSAVDCIAVGSHFQDAGPRSQLRGGALAERWTGGAWRVQAVPSPPGPNKFVNLSAVSCGAGGALGWQRLDHRADSGQPARLVREHPGCGVVHVGGQLHGSRGLLCPNFADGADAGRALGRQQLDDPAHAQAVQLGRRRARRGVLHVGDELYCRRVLLPQA
jgi:hypothetical protein